jgi:hypothetical protein
MTSDLQTLTDKLFQEIVKKVGDTWYDRLHAPFLLHDLCQLAKIKGVSTLADIQYAFDALRLLKALDQYQNDHQRLQQDPITEEEKERWTGHL